MNHGDCFDQGEGPEIEGDSYGYGDGDGDGCYNNSPDYDYGDGYYSGFGDGDGRGEVFQQSIDSRDAPWLEFEAT